METRLRDKSIFLAQASGRQIRYGTMEDLGRPARPEAGERQLGPFVLPPFQRDSVWTDEQKVRLVESFWLGLPVPAYVYNQSNADGSETDMWLVDGQQRWTAILGYLADEYPVYGHRFSELSGVDRKEFHSKSFPAVMTQIDDPVLLEDIYDRLAYGGTNHAPRDERGSDFPTRGM